MARKATGQVVERTGTRGRTYALRFRAYGKRRYITLGTMEDGWGRQRAEEELQNVLADVRRGVWMPHGPVEHAEPTPEPTFHEFASEWLEGRKADGLSERALADYRWSLTCHLLPHFAYYPLSAITVAEVDRYRREKVVEADRLRAAITAGKPKVERFRDKRGQEGERVVRPLSASSINKTLKHLAAVLDQAVEYGHLTANPAKGKRRRLKALAPRRASLTAEQVDALLRVAGKHRTLLATAILAGELRVSELTGLRWRDVDLADGWLTVAASKTEAGVRRVDLAPELIERLAEWKANSDHSAPDDWVFPTSAGTRRDRNLVRTRVLQPAVERANELLEREGRARISDDVTFHSLRRTYATLMAEAGADPAYTMAQIGHTDAKFTLSVYTDVGNRKHAGNARLGAILLGTLEGPRVVGPSATLGGALHSRHDDASASGRPREANALDGREHAVRDAPDGRR